MGGSHKRSAPARLLRECPARRDGSGFTRFLRDLFWHDGRASLPLRGQWGYLEANRSGSSRGPLRRSPNSRVMIRVVLPYHLRNLARTGEEVQLEVTGPVTLGAV